MIHTPVMTTPPPHPLLRVLDIRRGTSVDGPGLRTSVYFAGCLHRCPGCQNPDSWDFEAGTPYSVESLAEILVNEGFDVTFTGGDPAYMAPALVPLAEKLRHEGIRIWMFTGFTFDELTALPAMDRLLPLIDVVVDGPYVESLRDLTLRFRGSSNQRLVDAGRSLAAKSVILWEDPF